MCVCVLCLLYGHTSRRERCQTETVTGGLWYVPCAWPVCECQFLRRGALQCGCCRPVLTGTAVPSGVVWLSNTRRSDNVVQPPGSQTPARDMKIDKEAFGAFFDGTPGKTWDDYAS